MNVVYFQQTQGVGQLFEFTFTLQNSKISISVSTSKNPELFWGKNTVFLLI